jgi:hypothetical protein
MAWRKTGTFYPQQEILVMTCDVCERDIGHEDGRRPNSHYELRQVPNPGAIDNQAPSILLCSAECLRSFAAKTPSPRPSRSERVEPLRSIDPSEPS